tara:strand:+ start:164 stop:649 length:486 start_codon:yes stop_codon:yes gene_type:complete
MKKSNTILRRIFNPTLLLILILTTSFTLEVSDREKGEALFKAVTSKNLKTVKNLVEKKGADVNYVRRINEAFYIPVLMQAVMDDSQKIATYLINKGADVNAKDGFKMTSLMWASHNGNIELVKLLLEKGADKNCEDQHGMTAIKGAKEAGHTEIVEILSED